MASKYSISKRVDGELLLPSSSTLDPPDFISEGAVKFWHKMVADLGPAGMLQRVDTMSLALLCENLSDYWTLREDMGNMPAVEDLPDSADAANKDELLRIVDARTRIVDARARAITAIRGLDTNLRAWLSEMLLTPASRARTTPVLAPPAEKTIDFSQLDADERQALREMLERRQEKTTRMLQ